MFVVFEGIDGSGKTTVSNLVAAELRARGIAVEHVREGGEFASIVAGRIRAFGKDPRNMSMRPMAEMLMYASREAQVIAECIEPALGAAGVVFADRYLYSYEALGHHGRGLDLEQVRPVLQSVANGLWPDLVVLLDVDPHVARARRRVRKMTRASAEPASEGSRKGLGGVGVTHRVRQGYLEMAEADPKRWLVVDNTATDLGAVVQMLVEAIVAMHEGAPTGRVIAAARVPVVDVEPSASESLEDGRRAFYRFVEGRMAMEPQLAAYFLQGMADPLAYDLRESMLEQAPDVIAMGLRGLGDERAWALRRKLLALAPEAVARSLDGVDVEGAMAQEMRELLAPGHPGAVLGTLDGNDSESAWRLRHSLSSMSEAVLLSLKGIDTDAAWRLRETWLKEHFGDGLIRSAEVAGPLASSLRGLHGDRAWALRELCMDAAPVRVLASLAGVYCDRSWEWRSTYAGQAPRVVMRTFDQVDSPRAWALRREFAPQVKESLDSMVGLDGEQAWAIREALADVWPSTSVKSLGDLALEPRGAKFARSVLARHRANISLLKHVSTIAFRQSMAHVSVRRGMAAGS